MRLATMLRAISLALMIVGAARADDAPEVEVTARFVSIEMAPDCGVFITFSHAKYHVIAGPAGLVDKDIEVLVACAERPRSFAPGVGEFDSFKVGEVHDLILSPKNFIERGALIDAHADPAWWFLRAISLHVEQPKEAQPEQALPQEEEAQEVKPAEAPPPH
jgi:hypothetical protein